ncbi:MAG: zinc ABC transporter substrate-binding protein [Magnetospirillum sp. WYHS-4]
MRRRAYLTMALILCGPEAWAGDVPTVVASIAPVHSLVAAVMEGVGMPIQLVRGSGSPHTYNLKPSDASSLDKAKLVFLIDESLESFLRKPLKALAGKARVVRLAKAPGVRRLDAREGGSWDGDEHEHVHAAFDPHVWLDPANAIAMTDAVAAGLAQADPANAFAYEANRTKAIERLRALDESLKTRLAPVAGRPFVVYHDAYQYLESRYGLKAVGSVTVSPERKPGAKRLSTLRDKIKTLKAACLFSEPQFDPKLGEVLAEGTGARLGQLDPLGAALEAGPGLYPKLMEGLAGAIGDCLQ